MVSGELLLSCSDDEHILLITTINWGATFPYTLGRLVRGTCKCASMVYVSL